METVIFIGCDAVLPPLLLVVGARGPKVVMIDGRLTKNIEQTCMGSLIVHSLNNLTSLLPHCYK